MRATIGLLRHSPLPQKTNLIMRTSADLVCGRTGIQWVALYRSEYTHPRSRPRLQRQESTAKASSWSTVHTSDHEKCTALRAGPESVVGYQRRVSCLRVYARPPR